MINALGKRNKVITYKLVRFASFLSGGFTIMAVINPSERKLAKRTSVQCGKVLTPFRK